MNIKLNKVNTNPQKNEGPFWTATRVGVLTAQWALGTSVRDIARLLGSTRNTVIGKAHRMELPMHARAAGSARAGVAAAIATASAGRRVRSTSAAVRCARSATLPLFGVATIAAFFLRT